MTNPREAYSRLLDERRADIALREIIEDKIGFDLPEFVELTRPSGKSRRRPQHWTKIG